jgi:beta-N-acetylhexosaminidase
MINRCKNLILLLVLAMCFFPRTSTRASDWYQSDDPAASARLMLSKMSPEERVGQLFLVTFNGSTIDQNSPIYNLITSHHVGGVVLLASNDNFVDSPSTISSAYQLISQLQSPELPTISSQFMGTKNATPDSTSTPTSTPTLTASNYIPLFIGISQDGDGFPNDQILNGLTPLPDLMALGATWDTGLAEKVGAVAGQELSSIGINLFLGPSLDVLESPASTLGNGLGATVFGGDPYWVGAMGGAYISGLHSGSNGRLTVIADHFPGRGSADRPAGEEPATVRKSLEQLKQIELAPFFSVTGNSQTPGSTSDGLLVSHIRYQGFQGNIRSNTRPVSIDLQALSQILSLPPFATWREAGGLMVSDDLGSQTIRRFYDPGGQPFLARLVARDAFLAGNDLLFMGNIVSSDALDNFTTVVRTIEFFNQKYLEDPAFAQSVDDAVIRILVAKYRMYIDFSPSLVIPPLEGLTSLGKSEAETSEVARKSATLVSPNITDLDTVLPAPPGMSEHILFLTDTRPGSQCSTCGEESMLDVDALQNVVLRLFGPKAGGQVQGSHLISYSFTSLNAILDGGIGEPDLENSLRQAEWVVINMLDAEPGETQTTILRRFLSERQDLLRDKRIVVFAFNAPYYLDATDISKLTAYYCLYSKSAPFVDVAALLLFRELSPVGSLPVSVPGIGYDLFTATSPDPTQVIGLAMDLSPISATTPAATPESTPTPSFRVGDTVSVRTSIILDHNGHPVPDGTGVRFNILLSGEGGVVQQIDAVTLQGLAGASFSIDRPGLLEIRAESDPALTSVVLQLNVTGEGFSVTVVAPTPNSGLSPTSEPSVTPEVQPSRQQTPGYPGFGGWMMMVIVLSGLASAAYWFGKRFLAGRWGTRWALCIIFGGLVSYTYLAMKLPGTMIFQEARGWLGSLVIVLLGAAGGFGSAYVWWWNSKGSSKQSD